MTRDGNRWNQQTSVAVQATIREQFRLGRTHPGTDWDAGAVLATASATCREIGVVGAPGVVMRVAAATNVYARMFLPWAWTLAGETAWDPRALVFTRGEETMVDFLWVEPWDIPLPASAHFADAPGTVRVLDLLRPHTSRRYVDGKHTPLRVRAVA